MKRIMLPRVLTKIAPFITSIDSLEFRGIDLMEMLYNYNNITNDGNSHEAQVVLKEMMTQTRILVINWLVVWLLYMLYCLIC
jgi:hypothetical protein